MVLNREVGVDGPQRGLSTYTPVGNYDTFKKSDFWWPTNGGVSAEKPIYQVQERLYPSFVLYSRDLPFSIEHVG